MAAVATDGQGNYVTLDSSGKWVPMAAPAAPGQGEHGYAPTTPPEQPASTDIGDITASHPGEADIPPGMMQGPEGGGAPGRIVAAAKQGFSAPPFLTPEADARARADNNQTWMGRNIVQPAATLSELPLRAADAVGSGLGQGAYELGNAVDPALGRDFYMLNQLAPAFGMETPPRPATFSDARAGTNRGTLQVGPSQPPPVTLNDLTGAIERADQPQPAPAPQPAAQPSTNTTFLDNSWLRQAGDAGQGYDMGKGGTAMSSAAQQALDAGGKVQLVADGGAKTVDITRVTNGVMYDAKGQPWGSASIAFDGTGKDGLRITQPATAPPSASGPARAATPEQPLNNLAPGGSATQPPPPAPDPAIMTPAEIQARARGYYSSADQAAASNAMLPDANATAVRKLFSDAVPSDPEQARIAANQPAVQAGKNVDATGPMSFDTAMLLDRDLTDRMRASRGQDVHDLSQLQQGLRDQMDQVPDLASLRPARQAYTQYIKQSQMDDINYGASLKNDPAAAGAYVRQRAAALLKNDNAMRNWTPEETTALQQVATSGDIGMLGRLSVSLIKPITRMVIGGAGHAVAGPLGAIVGAEIGGDVGATQAARLRAYLSKTTLDPVMQQITRGVPPPNRLMPQQPP